MNKEFLQYLQKCPPDQLLVWTWLYSVTDEMESVVINLMDLRLRFKFSPKVFSRVLGLDEMQGKQFIAYEVEDKRTVKIQFHKKRKAQLTVVQRIDTSEGNNKELVTNKDILVSANGNVQKTENEETMISIGNGNMVIINEKKEDIAIRQVDFSTALRNGLLDDYKDFFIAHQKLRNSLMGLPSGPMLPPKIDGADVRFFKKLIAYFRSLPRQSGNENPLTDEECRNCMRKIYSRWEHFDSFLQNGIKPQQIWYNLNNIITQLTNSQINKNHRRNAAFDQKAERATERDFTKVFKDRGQAS